jgi:glutaminyl-tRNA synthetase
VIVLLQNSLTVLNSVLIDESAAKVNVYDRFQFERIGFFSVDPESNDHKVRIL